MLGKLLLFAGAALWMAAPAGNTAKTRNIEDRLNTAMPRIPWPQADPGPAGNSSYGASNSSYGPGNNSYNSGNYSYPIGGGGMGGSSDGWSGWQAGGAPTPHYHSINHTHDFGSLPADFNNLRNSYSDTVSAFNALRNDHSDLVSCVGQLRTSHSDMITAYNALRSSHSDLVSNHNDIVNRLGNANILQ